MIEEVFKRRNLRIYIQNNKQKKALITGLKRIEQLLFFSYVGPDYTFFEK